MKVIEAMKRGVQTISSDSSCSEAAKKMQAFDVGILPVKEGDTIVGVLTDRDIVIRCIAEDFDPRATSVREAMTAEAICCFQDEDLWDAARRLETNQIHRLLVLDEDNQLTGMLSLSDLALRGDDEQMKSEVLERICEPA